MTKADNEFFRPEDFISVWQMNGPQAIADQANRLLKERGLLAILDAAIRFHKTRANSAEHLSADCDLMNATGAYLETIEKADTAEGLLREMMEQSEYQYGHLLSVDLVNRAKKLLGG